MFRNVVPGRWQSNSNQNDNCEFVILNIFVNKRKFVQILSNLLFLRLKRETLTTLFDSTEFEKFSKYF